MSELKKIAAEMREHHRRQIAAAGFGASVLLAWADALDALAAKEPVAAVCVKPLVWSDPSPPNDSCRYTHVSATSPFGPFLITWKGWKDHDSPTIDETPWGFGGVAFDVESAKAMVQAEYEKRVLDCIAPQPAPPQPAVPEEFEKALDRYIRAIDDQARIVRINDKQYGFETRNASARTFEARTEVLRLYTLAGAAMKVPAWRLLSELKDTHVSVLLTDGNYQITGFLTSDRRILRHDTEFWPEATHWMPLPAPPALNAAPEAGS